MLSWRSLLLLGCVLGTARGDWPATRSRHSRTGRLHPPVGALVERGSGIDCTARGCGDGGQHPRGSNLEHMMARGSSIHSFPPDARPCGRLGTRFPSPPPPPHLCFRLLPPLSGHGAAYNGIGRSSDESLCPPPGTPLASDAGQFGEDNDDNSYHNSKGRYFEPSRSSTVRNLICATPPK